MLNSARFRPTRAGIINLWDYRDQEFSFADGRLVLRGPNGSGKTKALEVLFPFVFDGRIEPRRLNPFAGEERTMRSNLLYRGQDSAYSYVWMEFSRGRSDDPEAVTVGIGMRATRGNDKVTRWYFVVDGRVGVDFSLLDAEDRPLTRRQLIDEIGADSICDRPVEYREAIDARMFGLGTQRYDQLINLILTLRRPQLAKNLDPKGLSQALTDGLRPLDEQLVVEAARSFSDMEEVARTLESLAAADDAAQSFVSVYTRYLQVQAKADIDQIASRLSTVDTAIAALRDATRERDLSAADRAAADERSAAAEHTLEQARTNLEALQRSSAYEGKQQLDDLAQAVANLERTTSGQAEQAQRAQAAVVQRTDEHDRAAEAVTHAAAAAARAEDAVREAAADAGVEFAGLDGIDRVDRLSAALEARAEERENDLRVVRAARARVDGAAAARSRAESAAAGARTRRDAAHAAVETAETVVTLARTETADLVHRWWSEHSGALTAVGVPDVVFEAVEEAYRAVGSDDAVPPSAVLSARVADALEEARFRRRSIATEIATAEEHIAVLTGERAAVSAEHDDAPPPFAARTDSRDGRAGAPLWRLVRFRDDVDLTVATGVEAALQAANLLDGWVCCDDSVPDAASELFLAPLPEGRRPTGPTLADVLVPEPDAGVPVDRITQVLASVALTAAPDLGTPIAVDVHGGFRQGIQIGRHRKDHPEYIGATARQRRRDTRIAEIDRAVALSRETIDRLREEDRIVGGRLADVERAVAALPRTGAVLAALRKVAESAGALRTAGEAAASADRDLDQAVAEVSAQEQQMRSVAVRHRIPFEAREIDAVEASIRHFRSRGQTLLRAVREHTSSTERGREARVRLDEAVRAAAEAAEAAAIAESSLLAQQQKLETLQDALGASADRIDAQLAEARSRIEAAKDAQRAARRSSDAAVERIGKAEAAHTAAEQTLRAALTEVRSDAERLVPYARRDVLALLGIDQEYTWPGSAAWLDVDQVLYRVRRATGEAVPVVPDEVAALFGAVQVATASVSTAESARKSTRSALTSALQEFDDRLAVSGQDYRLQWDAPDGVTVVQVHDDQGPTSVAQFAQRIASDRRDQELLLTDAERRILEDALLAGLAQQIHERTADARELIGRMGTEMRQRHMSSGNTIGVHWVLADHLDDGARAVCRLLDRDTSSLSPEELASVRAHFAARIRAERAAHPERSYPEILASTLDYRRWRVFAFGLVAADGTEERLTPARHSALSGGEQSVSLHLPLFAAAHVMLDSADPHAPRLLALDEAFAGVDDTGRSELLGLSVQFDLDLFMTGFDLWITYAGVPGCAHYDLAHSVVEHTVAATLLVWTSGGLLAEHDGTDLATALGSPGRRRVPEPVDGTFEFA